MPVRQPHHPVPPASRHGKRGGAEPAGVRTRATALRALAACEVLQDEKVAAGRLDLRQELGGGVQEGVGVATRGEQLLACRLGGIVKTGGYMTSSA